jgi:two-component system response regulator HydG
VRPRLLIVDDDPAIPKLFTVLLGEGYEVDPTSSGAEALRRLGERVYDLLITDLMMPEMTGLDLLAAVHRREPDLPIIVVTGQATIETAVEAMKGGAFDYLRKAVSGEELRAAVDRAARHGSLAREVRRLRSEIDEARGLAVRDDDPQGGIIGRSTAIRSMLAMGERVATSDASVLLLGESGTGKELLARHIHRRGPRQAGPFVAFDGSALSPALIESELFGHEKGAFTGSIRSRRGLFREAHGGTLFIDEIGDLAPEVQNKLLRVLQEREIRPVGSDATVKVDVRVITATNKDLKALVARGAFREDLYFRLAVVPIEVPPLRERLEDLPLLVAHFLTGRRGGASRTRPSDIRPEAMAKLAAYPWPGNVRELENVIERAAILTDKDAIGAEDLPSLGAPVAAAQAQAAGGVAAGGPSRPLREMLAEATRTVEIHALRDALKETGGNPTAAAHRLGISRASLYAKLKLYDIKP